MSRIGRIPVTIPAGVTVTIDDKKNTITVKGPLGTLTEQIHPRIRARVEGDKIHVERSSDEKEERGLHGLTRALDRKSVV